jgi:hypothetical protein
VASHPGIVVSTPTIVELVELCERMAAVNRRLFEIVGSWVADESDPTAQRHFSTGAHRHAWHADLWEARRPAVPIGAGDAGLDAAASLGSLRPVAGDDATLDRLQWYHARLRELLGRLDGLLARVDDDLDPSTARTATLTRADVIDLLGDRTRRFD